MVRDIRSTPLRYGLALGSFGLALLVILGLPRITSIRIDLTTLIIFVMIGSAWKTFQQELILLPIADCRLPISDCRLLLCHLICGRGFALP